MLGRRRIGALVGAALLAVAGSACGADEERGGGTAETTAAAPARTAAETNAAGCRAVAAPPQKEVPAERRAPSLRIERGAPYRAVVRTSCGTFTIALDTRRAPRTAASFAALAREDFYDGTTIHRIVPDFVIQGGDPNGDGTGGPGYTIVEEPPDGVSYPKYAVAMAKTQADPPGASGSQFYVVTSDEANAVLEPIYAPLGRVTEGRDVIDRIASVAADPQSQVPFETVVIEDVAIERGAPAAAG